MIRVMIADDHPVVREGLRRIMAACPDFELVAEAEDGAGVAEKVRQARPDVLLLDIAMPGPGFIEVLRRVRDEFPDTRVLVLSMHEASHYAVRALRGGAMGYLTKERSPEELADAIRRVYGGRKYLTPEVAESIAGAIQDATPDAPHELLSDREYQVFLMLGAAKSVTEIAAALGLSPKTVSTHRARILAKMRMGSNAELIRYAIRSGLAE